MALKLPMPQQMFSLQNSESKRSDANTEPPDIVTRNVEHPGIPSGEGEALEALKGQFKAYSAGDSPFDRKRRLRESPREWWERLLTHDDAAVLAVSRSLFDSM